MKRKVVAWIVCMTMVLSLIGGIKVEAATAVCKIGTTEYSTFEAGLSAVQDGETIELLQDIVYNGKIDALNKSYTLDINNYNLEINSAAYYTIRCINSNKLTIVNNSNDPKTGSVRINNTASGATDRAIGLEQSGEILIEVPTTITANGLGVYIVRDGVAELSDANISANNIGVLMHESLTNGNKFKMNGTIAASNIGLKGVKKGEVSFVGDIEGGNNGVYAENDLEVNVTGDIIATDEGSVGVWARSGTRGSLVTVDGKINAPKYIKINDEVFAKNDSGVQPTTKEGYITYKDLGDSANPQGTVWVKGVPAPSAENANISGISKVGETLTGEYEYNSSLEEDGTTYKWLRNNGRPQSIFQIHSIAGVSSGPPNPSIITITEDSFITHIRTYHYYNGGTLPGTIKLINESDGTIHGPWDATGTIGQGGVNNASWNVYPNMTLPAGDYRVEVSNHSTWSYTRDTGDRGMVYVYGNPIYDGEYTEIEGANDQTYTLVEEDAGSMIKFEVTVRDLNNQVGEPLKSNAFGPVEKNSSTLSSSSDATLESLTASSVTLNPSFDSETTEYSGSVSNTTTSTAITVTPTDSNVTIIIEGVEGNIKEVDLVEGENTFEIEVTAEDGTTTKTYTITITRAEATPTEPPISSSGGSGGSSSTSYYYITPKASDGGRISPATKVELAKNKSKAFTITPDEGYIIEDVLVDGRSVGSVSQYEFDAIKSNHTIEAKFIKEESEKVTGPPILEFEDLNLSAWYMNGINYILERDLFKGTSETLFEPNVRMTRAMLTTVLHRLEQTPQAIGGHPFIDAIDGDWYQKSIAWASEKGITEGYSEDIFKPNNPLSREEMAAILYRFASYKGYDISASADLSKYGDADDIFEWALPAMKWAVAEGLIEGIDETTLQPKGYATRAQVATILMRFIETIK